MPYARLWSCSFPLVDDTQYRTMRKYTCGLVPPLVTVLQDVVVFEETDEAFYVGVGKSRSENIIYISSGEATDRVPAMGG